MAVVRADLARLPARHGVVAGLAAADVELGEDFLDVLLGVPLLLFVDVEDVHADPPVARFLSLCRVAQRLSLP